jgi:hypothetical protein
VVFVAPNKGKKKRKKTSVERRGVSNVSKRKTKEIVGPLLLQNNQTGTLTST